MGIVGGHVNDRANVRDRILHRHSRRAASIEVEGAVDIVIANKQIRDFSDFHAQTPRRAIDGKQEKRCAISREADGGACLGRIVPGVGAGVIAGAPWSQQAAGVLRTGVGRNGLDAIGDNLSRAGQGIPHSHLLLDMSSIGEPRIAMHNAGIVGSGEPRGNLDGDVDGLAHAEGSAAQRLAIHQFGDDVAVPHIVDCDDIG